MSATSPRFALRCLALGMMLAGCAGHPGSTTPEQTARLEVVNRSSSDMDIFIVNGGQRIRLGLAPGNQTTPFTLAPSQVMGGGSIRFLAVPISGLARPIGSEPVMAGTRDTIRLEIPPP